MAERSGTSSRPGPWCGRAHAMCGSRRARHAWWPTRSAGSLLPEARTLLDFSARGAARNISKLIASAAANAENNHELVADDMQIADIQVDGGPTLKRWRARARGRAARIEKRTSHVSVALTPAE